MGEKDIPVTRLILPSATCVAHRFSQEVRP